MFDRLPSKYALSTIDPEIAAAIQAENRRQEEHIELIASENYTTPAVLAGPGITADQQGRRGLPWASASTAVASTSTWWSNWPSTAWKKLFGAEHANVSNT